MRYSLKTKFIALVLLSLALAIIPATLMASSALRQAMLELERTAFNSLTVQMEESVLQRYMNLQKFEALNISNGKEYLLSLAHFIGELWRMHGQEAGWDAFRAALPALLQELHRSGVVLDVYAGEGRLRMHTPLFTELVRNVDRTDFKGDALRSMLDVAPPDEGLFAVFRLDEHEWRNIKGHDAVDKGDAVLVLFTALGDGVLCLAQPLIGMDLWPQHRKNEILREMFQHLERMNDARGVAVSILSQEGAVLANSSPVGTLDPHCIPSGIFSQARTQKIVEFMEYAHEDPATGAHHGPDFSGALYRVAYIRTLNWYLVTAVETNALEAPGNALARRLGMMGLAAVVFSLLGSLLLTERLTAPLRALSQQARKLAATDFSRPEALEAETQGLRRNESLRRRRDEVGELAGAFAHMEEALHDNIRHLMDVTAAKERMQGELDAARRIQRGILPPSNIPLHAACDLAALLEPAKEVGGDFYDFFLLPDRRMAMVIGDVSDKGVPAALFMAMTVALVRSALHGGLPPAAVLDYANAALCAHNPQSMFVTLWVGVLNPHTGALDYANGGHCPPLLLPPPGHVPNVPVRSLDFISGPLVGALEGVTYENASLRLQPGEACLLYSDGVTEAESSSEEFFGMCRLSACLEDASALSPAALLAHIHAEVEAFRRGREQTDDITMLCVRWLKPLPDPSSKPQACISDI